MSSDLTDKEIERIALGILDTSHPYAEWGHAEHFAFALWLLRHPEKLAELGGIEPILRSYNVAVGVPETETRGYHATITLASMGAAAAHLARHDDGTALSTVLCGLMRSEQGDPKWLLKYWSAPILTGTSARRGYVTPDLMPLPFAEHGRDR